MQFTSFDGKQIFVREWQAENPVGIVQIAHGMNEYAARYDKFARRLGELGYMVVADDHRGHGDTDGETLGYAPGDMFADTVEDMAQIAAFYRGQFSGIKYVIFGFSYGSFLTQSFIEKHADLADGAVIAGSSRQSAPAVRAGLLLASLGCLCKGEDAPARLVNKVVFGGYDKKFNEGPWQWLSCDRENNARYSRDPFCTFTCSNNFFRSFFRGLAGLYRRKNAAGLRKDMPLLLISGAEDPVGGAKGVARLAAFYKKQEMRAAEQYLIAGSRHEFLNEQVHFEEAFGRIADFLQAVQPSAAE